MGICAQLGPCKVDLFATRLNHQLDHYVSWRPDPGAMATDAFHLSWKDLQGYAFPLLTDRQVPPEGENRTEHSCPSGSPVAEPDVPNAGTDGGVPVTSARLERHTERSHGPTALVCLNRLRLAAWRVSGSNIKQQEFQRKLLNYCWPIGAKE